jgi:hypothetical protein
MANAFYWVKVKQSLCEIFIVIHIQYIEVPILFLYNEDKQRMERGMIA